MGLSLCKWCCWIKRRKVRIKSNNFNLNILLLGLDNVGKTEIGCVLAGKRRTRYEPTNGVQCFQMTLPDYSISITEIGGNKEMLKLWHHYYAKTMGLIFCYDLSATLQQMEISFQLLNQIISHPFMRGKAILLVGTKSDLVNDTIQLYDIENTFGLETLANRYFSSLKSIYFNPREVDNLWSGLDWLTSYLEINKTSLRGRITYDTMRESMQKKRRKRLRLSCGRPKTAPANLDPECPIPVQSTVDKSKNVFRVTSDSAQPYAGKMSTTT